MSYSHLVTRLWIVAIALVVWGGGCSGQQAAEPVLRVWHFWSAPQHQPILQALVADFERKYHCRVELTPLTWNEGRTKLMAAFSSGNAPDVIELGSDWIAQFSSSGVLAELGAEFVQPDQWLPWALLPCRWNGRYYAIPWVVDTRVLFVNTELVAKAAMHPPTTLDELYAVAAAVQERTEAVGFATTGADEHRLYKKILPLMWTFGGDVLDSMGHCVLYSEPNVRALELYAALSRNGIIDTQKQLDAAFVRGDVALWNSGSWLLEKIERENPSLPYTVLPMPGLVKGSIGVSFAGGEYWAVAQTSANKELARAFIAFMSACPQATRFCRQVPEAGFPAQRHCFSDTSIARHRFKQVFATQLLRARMTPVHPRWVDIERILESAVVEVLYGRRDARSALRVAHSQIAELLRR